jgi:simple sugar transport system ATP-binding protein
MASEEPHMTTPIVEMRNITKRFPGVLANDDVTISLNKGEIVALLGENGAGKTTLMNILYGLLTQDSGDILISGEVVQIKSPRQAIDQGIGMVHQHFMLVEPFTVTENIILGTEPTRADVIDFKKARAEVVAISEKYGLAVDPDAKIIDLPVGMQQRVEILKALYKGASILILDEPTAVLTPQEVDELFEVVRALVDEGLSVVFITHKLDEVLDVSDRVVVMRAGAVVGTTTPQATDQAGLAKMMVGREVVFRVEKKPSKCGDTILEIEGLKVLDERKLEAVRGIDFTVCAGEVVAIAGVSGNGQSELIEAITGLRKAEEGSVRLAGEDITRDSVRKTTEAGISHVPEDRLRRGLVLEFDLNENMILGDHHKLPFANRGFMNSKEIARVTQERVDDYDVRTPSTAVLAGTLSGGNQQKLVLARELGRDPELLIAAQPTRGLDVGAIEFVHTRILDARDAGKGVLLISLELEEVQSLADRILVMYEGRIVKEFLGGEATNEDLGFYMTGGVDEDGQALPTPAAVEGGADGGQ